jgi:hypothetical protein
MTLITMQSIVMMSVCCTTVIYAFMQALYGKCHFLDVVMLSGVMLSVIMLSGVILSVVMLSVVAQV